MQFSAILLSGNNLSNLMALSKCIHETPGFELLTVFHKIYELSETQNALVEIEVLFGNEVQSR